VPRGFRASMAVGADRRMVVSQASILPVERPVHEGKSL
jgi:hypothetical protein